MTYKQLELDINKNNFDLLRLFAATSVCIFHTIHRLDIEISGYLMFLLHKIPGVPIFFFISGFLISMSFKRARNISKYTMKRILRIYPALYICLLFSIISLFYVGYLKIDILTTSMFWSWILAQITFVQFYNPDFLRDYGTGVLNGSLWTIAVELQFYILVPFLYNFFLKNNVTIRLIYLILFFSFLNIVFNYIGTNKLYADLFIYKLIYVSFIPWFYMFLIGILLQENFDKIKLFWKFRLLVRATYILFVLIFFILFDLNPITFFLLITVLLIFVYSYVNTSCSILSANDYSYGIYIYHAVIINFFIYKGYMYEMKYLFYILLLSFVCAFFSWHLIEKPILRRK